jgi:hypothetical protein
MPTVPIAFTDQVPHSHATVANLNQGAIKHAIAQLCRTNFLIFQKVELGMEIGPQHRTWWEHLQDGRDVVEMAPRDHGKSQSLTQAYPLWCLKYDPWIQEAFILGADGDLAHRNLDQLKALMANRPSVSYLLPTGRQLTNSRTELQLTNGKTIKTKGLMSPHRGRHPQLIICDDILNEENSLDKDKRADIRKRFFEVITPMKDRGLVSQRARGFWSKIVVVGTAQDREDLYHELMENPEYTGTKLSAVLDDTTKQALWPERYPYDALMEIKRKIGTLPFSKEYLNDPLSDETTIFPTSLFEPLKDRQLSYVRNRTGALTFLGADFSVPGTTDGDWTVLMVLEYEPPPQNLYTLLYYWRARPTQIQEQINQLEYLCQAYQISLGYLEDNHFQGIYARHMNQKTNLPLRGHTVGANKRSTEIGILSLRTIFENLRFRFPYATDADRAMTDHVISEFNGVRQRFGRIGNETTNDDCVMALWHSVRASQSVRFEADF